MDDSRTGSPPEMFGVIDVRFDYLFDEKTDDSVREWEKMNCRRQFEEKIYTVAMRLDGATFANGQEHYCIVSSGEAVRSGFIETHEYENLIRFGQSLPMRGVWIGIGMGDTMTEARSRSLKALNRSIADAGAGVCVSDSDTASCRPVRESGDALPGDMAESFARKIGTSPGTLMKISEAAGCGEEAVTAGELARKLGITARSTNRILERLEDCGCVTLTGKWTTGRGRPARLLKITLPPGI